MRMNEFVLTLLLGQEGGDAALARLGHARDQCPVDLARRTRAEGLGERRGGEPGLRHQQAAGGILVEPVHQARALAVGVAQHVEHAIEMARGAGAALHRQPHGLVEHQHVVVFVERDGFEEITSLDLGLAPARARLALLEPQRRDAHRLPGFEPLLSLRALAVHAQLALTDDALDMGERQPGKARLEEAIDAHAGFVRAHLGGLHAASRRGGSLRPAVARFRRRAHGHRRSSSAGAPAQSSTSRSPRIRSVMGTLLTAPSPQQRAPMCQAGPTR